MKQHCCECSTDNLSNMAVNVMNIVGDAYGAEAIKAVYGNYCPYFISMQKRKLFLLLINR